MYDYYDGLLEFHLSSVFLDGYERSLARCQGPAPVTATPQNNAAPGWNGVDAANGERSDDADDEGEDKAEVGEEIDEVEKREDVVQEEESEEE